MKTLGNVLWIIFGGAVWAFTLLMTGVVWCVTIIGIPLGLQAFKMAGFVLLPFGKTVTVTNPTGLKKVLNILWAIFCGWIMALGFLFTGVLMCITIIGIPFGKQYFKLASFIIAPLGKNFR